MRRLFVGVLVIGCLGLAPLPGTEAAPPGRATVMARAAAGFLALLSPAQRATAALPFEHPARRRWQATPGRRHGLAWGALTGPQRVVAETLLRTGLSEDGLRRFRGVVRLEGILRLQEAARTRFDRSWRDPGLYWIAVFGRPEPGGTWSWRIEGHHYSRHFTCAAGRVSVTPAFHGANPARVMQGPQKGLRVLAAEEDEARALLASLRPHQRARAVLPEPPRDFLPRAPRDVVRTAPRGLPATAMDPAQYARLWRLIDVWIGALHPELAGDVRARFRALRPGEIRFAWMGSDAPGAPHAYRVHGPAFFLEYWQAGNHVHSVWRGMADEYGAADLARAPR